jgi:O-succinylbenzoate synthase
VSAEEIEQALAPVTGHPMARSALEAAIWDAELRNVGRSLADSLGATRTRVPAGVAVGLMDSIPELLDAVGAYLDLGYLRVKLKIQNGWDLAPVQAVRRQFGDIPLQVDANMAYSAADHDHLAGFDEFDLLMIEQPLARDDLEGHANLAREIQTPICLDESITSTEAAVTAIELGACSVINIKPGRVGGLLEAVRLHDFCVDNGIPAWCGGMLESGIGRAANLALAALPGFTLVGDLSASSRYFSQDITPPFELDNGHIAVPTGPGIGVEPVREILEQMTISTELIEL